MAVAALHAATARLQLHAASPRDESGARALAELRDRGIGLVANALDQSAEHVRSCFGMLRTELAFYVGCMNLHEELDRKRVSMCMPSPVVAKERRLSLQGLSDACLALSMDQRVIGNDVDADWQDLVIVTGANQGGKSTFLRSVGLAQLMRAQLMMLSGMFVSAGSFCSSICVGVFTHCEREEDTGMKSGQLDEELSRMSEIIDHLTAHPMILFNESFAATNEREGSEIAKQIISALLNKPVKAFAQGNRIWISGVRTASPAPDFRSSGRVGAVREPSLGRNFAYRVPSAIPLVICVAHLYELIRGLYEGNAERIPFLRAERQAGGDRTFKLVEGEPLQTSFGEDLYNSICCAGTVRQRIGTPGICGGAP